MVRAWLVALFCTAGCTLIVGSPDPRDHSGNGGFDLSNGACADVQTDPHNCGACGHDCSRLAGVDPFAVRCTIGVCDLRNACLPGRADCSGGYADGCETDLDTADHCGSCTAECGGDLPLCARNTDGSFICAATCSSSTPTECGTSCVDTQDDPRHCGSCANACPAGANQIAVCQNGLCSSSCSTGFHSCNGVCSDNTSLNSCGAVCTPCAAPPPNSVEICDPFAGCDFRCNPGFSKGLGDCEPIMSSMDMATKPGPGDMAVDNRPPCDCSGLASACLLGCVGKNCCDECTASTPFPLCTTATCNADPSCKPS